MVDEESPAGMWGWLVIRRGGARVEKGGGCPNGESGELVYEEFRNIPDGDLFGAWDALMERILNEPNRRDRHDVEAIWRAATTFKELVQVRCSGADGTGD